MDMLLCLGSKSSSPTSSSRENGELAIFPFDLEAFEACDLSSSSSSAELISITSLGVLLDEPPFFRLGFDSATACSSTLFASLTFLVLDFFINEQKNIYT